jgi:hypothetical protein
MFESTNFKGNNLLGKRKSRNFTVLFGIAYQALLESWNGSVSVKIYSEQNQVW